MQNDELIREQLIKFLEEIGVDVGYRRFTSDNLMLRCPFASVSGHQHSVDTNPSLGIKIGVDGFYFNCFTCHRKGRSLVEFVKMLKNNGLIESGMDAYQIQNSIKVSFPNYYEEYEVNKRDEYDVNIDKWKILTRSFYEYHRKRKIHRSIIKDVDLHYIKEERRVIFPCYDYSGNLEGYVAHYINGKLPKYKNYVDAGRLLYLESLIKGKIGVIVEGMYDAIKTYQHLKRLNLLAKYSVVGTFGGEVAEEQIKKIIRFFDSVILYGDNDVAGIAMEKSIFRAVSKKLPRIFKLVYKGKDPDMVDIKQFQEILKNCVLYKTVA